MSFSNFGTVRARQFLGNVGAFDTLNVTNFAPSSITGTAISNSTVTYNDGLQAIQGRDPTVLRSTLTSIVNDSNLVLSTGFDPTGTLTYLSDLSNNNTESTLDDLHKYSMAVAYSAALGGVAGLQFNVAPMFTQTIYGNVVTSPQLSLSHLARGETEPTTFSNGYVLRHTNATTCAPTAVTDDPDNIKYSMFSCSKTYILILLLVFLKKNILTSLDTKICDIFTSFPRATSGKLKYLGIDAMDRSQDKLVQRDPTVRDLLTYSSGLIMTGTLADQIDIHGTGLAKRRRPDGSPGPVTGGRIQYASNLNTFISQSTANKTTIVFPEPTVYGLALFVADGITSALGVSNLAFTNTASHYVDEFYANVTEQGRDVYFYSSPGDISSYHEDSHMLGCVLEKLYADYEGVDLVNARPFSNIFQKEVGESLGLTYGDDYFTWLPVNQFSNVVTPLINQGEPKNLSTDASVTNYWGSDITKTGLSLLKTIRTPSWMDKYTLDPIGVQGTPFLWDASGNAIKLLGTTIAGLQSPFTANVNLPAPPKYELAPAGISSTMKTMCKVMSLISNKGYYGNTNLFDFATLENIIDSRRNAKSNYAQYDGEHIVGLHSLGEELLYKRTNIPFTKYVGTSITADGGIAYEQNIKNIRAIIEGVGPTILNDSANLALISSNIGSYEIIPSQPLVEGYVTARIFVSKGATGSISYMCPDTGDTVCLADTVWSFNLVDEFASPAHNAVRSSFANHIIGKLEPYDPTKFIPRPYKNSENYKIRPSQLYDRETLDPAYKYVDPEVLRVTKMEVYPTAAAAVSELVQLTNDGDSNLVVSNTTATFAKFGP